ncbi:MAG: hypothetical protein CM1200mP16_13990 [Nitrospina sp.]|nr:MAG: hypothetical protein CM1200mP16_13990 [Nitrospina sp.]
MRIEREERPGAVHLELPEDIAPRNVIPNPSKVSFFVVRMQPKKLLIKLAK